MKNIFTDRPWNWDEVNDEFTDFEITKEDLEQLAKEKSNDDRFKVTIPDFGHQFGDEERRWIF